MSLLYMRVMTSRLKKTVRRQEERLLNSEKMEADFGRDSRQLEQDLLILQACPLFVFVVVQKYRRHN